jgi:hypothetical protein
MFKVRGLFSKFFLVALAGLVVLSACQSAEAAAPKASDFDFEQAAEHMSLRWQAKGRAYERLSHVQLGLDPDDLSSQRWNAMAASYDRLASLDDVMVRRWQAMGRFYERDGMLTGDSTLTVANQN